MSAKLIVNNHFQIYKYTEYGQWPNKCLSIHTKKNNFKLKVT